jgi:carbonic anhydrase/acetyltransferase-like protein (isoleucine patch superfamily)
MGQKYKIRKDLNLEFPDKTLYRIEALRDIGYRVRKGDLGGYIESESNLSQFNDCWVFHDAKVYDQAVISNDAEVSGQALVFDKARVYGEAQVYGNAVVYDQVGVYVKAQVYGNAIVSGHAQIHDNARVYGEAEIHSGARVNNNMILHTKQSFIFIVGCKYNITITLTGINIGCKHYKDLEDFMSRVDQEADENGYDLSEKEHLIASIQMNIKYLQKEIK